MADKIDEIIQQRKKPMGEAEGTGDAFFSVMGGDGMTEFFLELRFQNGLQTCFNYTDLMWFNHDPEGGCIDLAFGDFLVTIKGRGLANLFSAIKSKRVAWVKEADSEFQDNNSNSCFISEIAITPPKDFAAEDTASE